MLQAQSYYSVLFRGRYTIYEARLMVKIVQRARQLFGRSPKYSDFIQKAYRLDGVNVVMAFPVSELLGGRSHNYEPLKSAVRSLKSWQVEYYDKQSKTWHLASMLDNATLNEREGMLTITCSQWLLEFICDFSNGGYRAYTFEVAMSMRNPFAARLYMLTCSMSEPLVYSIDGLREVLGVSMTHSRVHDFFRRVLDPAAKELEARGANGFKYEIIRKYKDKPRSKPTAIRLIPVKREGVAAKTAREVTSDIFEAIPASLIQFLALSAKFSYKEIGANKAVLKSFASIEGWQNKLVDIIDRARRKGKNHGYIIAAIKGHVAESGAK